MDMAHGDLKEKKKNKQKKADHFQISDIFAGNSGSDNTYLSSDQTAFRDTGI